MVEPRAPLLCVLLVSACSVGDGTGEARGEVSIAACDLEGELDLEPDYFAAEFFEKTVSITLQRGGDYQVKSDGITIVVPDVEDVDDHLDEPLAVGYQAGATLPEIAHLLRASLYLNETCDRDHDVGLVGMSGSVTFYSIGDGSIDEDDRIEGVFSIAFAEAQGGEGQGHLEGRFRFRYTRGRPAQRFP